MRVSPVERDGNEMQYRCGAAEHIAGRPHVAEFGAERPLVAHLVDRPQGHHQACNKQVSHRQ